MWSRSQSKSWWEDDSDSNPIVTKNAERQYSAVSVVAVVYTGLLEYSTPPTQKGKEQW